MNNYDAQRFFQHPDVREVILQDVGKSRARFKLLSTKEFLNRLDATLLREDR